MQYDVKVSESDGTITATCPALGVSGSGQGVDAALVALRNNMQYHLELCPCSSIDEDWIELNVEDQRL